MGRQINFYMSENTQAMFINYLEQNQFKLLDNNAKIIKCATSNNVFGMYLYKQSYGGIIMRQDNRGIIDSIKSPVIQFVKTIIKEEYKKVLRGRMWITDKYNDNNGILIEKDVNLIREYNKLNHWIKRNVPYQEIKKGNFIVKEYVNDDVKELQKKGFSLSL